jgi:hypothetical protein
VLYRILIEGGKTMSRKRRENAQQKTRWIDNPWVRRAITLLLLGHLTALFAGPFQLASTREDGTSPFANMVYQAVLPYMRVANLDQGYQFFAPNPGPTHLVRYKVEFNDGREPLENHFPNLDEQWPRLLYHRHMMLSEYLNGLAPPPQNMSPQQWEESLPRKRNLDELSAENRGPEDWCAESYADHLLRKHGGSRVTLTVVRHGLANIEQIRAGVQLDDAASYTDLVEFTRRAQQ